MSHIGECSYFFFILLVYLYSNVTSHWILPFLFIIVGFPPNRKRLDATLQDLEEKQNSKKEAVSIFPLNMYFSCFLWYFHGLPLWSNMIISSWLFNFKLELLKIVLKWWLFYGSTFSLWEEECCYLVIYFSLWSKK